MIKPVQIECKRGKYAQATIWLNLQPQLQQEDSTKFLKLEVVPMLLIAILRHFTNKA